MNKIIKLYGLVLILLIGNSVHAAETHVVKMLNTGASGSMVFEPAFIKINSGSTLYKSSVEKPILQIEQSFNFIIKFILVTKKIFIIKLKKY